VANVAQVMFYNATSKEITYGNNISGAGNITGGNALFSGTLTVNGNVTYINSNVVTINDLAINLANNAANVTQVNGGGIELGPQGTPYVTFLYNNSANTFTSNVGLSAVANISGGNVLTAGLISATANITGGNITTAGVLKISGALSYIDVAGTGFIQNAGMGEMQISTAANRPLWINTNAGSKLWTFGIDGNLASPGAITATGNITGGNVLTGGLISSTGNITGGNILTAGIMSSTGNVTGGNIITAGLITATGNISGGNLTITGNTATITTANYSVGYLNIPQVSLAANTTTALTDSGKHYYSTSASNLALTIANNTSVVWPVGTAISVVNRGTANITVAGDTGVSLYLAGNSTSGNRIVTTYGMATVMNVAANIWMISGTVV
jgi:filamentous hemagglutinin